MIGRPCKPDADLKGLWRTLLGTPFPACGVADDAESPDDQAAVARSENQDVKQDATQAASPRK
jgi:hypothetical protein